MSEKHPQLHESHRSHHESEKPSEHQERLQQKLETEANEASKNGSQERLANAQKKIESLASNSEELKHVADAEQKVNDREPRDYIGEQKVSFSRTMTRVRKRLTMAEKPFSKVIHNPIIDKVSEVAGQTVARPSSMLGGAFFSLVGTSALLWITKHYGYEYNYLAVILLFVIGMIAGLVIEAVLKLRRSR